jgi:expansin (peptidoglycan-binding protein)
VRCKIPQLCDDNGAYVVVTDYGEGDRTDFIMSPRAFFKLGRNEVASEKLKKYGVLDVEYKRVPCTFKGNNIVYKINENSNNPYYFAINILYVGGTYDVTTVEIWQVYYLHITYLLPFDEILLIFKIWSIIQMVHFFFTII